MNAKDIHDAYTIGRKSGIVEAINLAVERDDNKDDKFVIGYNTAIRLMRQQLEKLKER